MSESFYITTTLPYVNADPHVGFAMEIIRADIIARAKKLQGYDVFFNTGTDEHGQKLFTAAAKAGKDVKRYVDEYAEKFRQLKDTLGISDDVHFIRTTDPHHEQAAQEFWKRVNAAGYIYKKNYKIKYCVGCEEEKSESQLEGGKCPIHPTLEIELIDEENYFFKYSAFGEKLQELYDLAEKDGRSFVLPKSRLNEVREFIARGLEDFSISRLASKMPWGIPVPGDANHVMYVWFDALVNYISTLGWPDENGLFKTFWVDGTPTQYCGKDNTRFQAAMWQAMLFAAGLPNSYQIVTNGFVTGDGGIKMSKSLGNVINPFDVVAEYGTDALRYFVAREIGAFEDSPFTMDRFKEAYNGNLANGLGNLVSRIMKMAETYLAEGPALSEPENMSAYSSLLNQFEINKAADMIWMEIAHMDQYIQTEQPFKVIKENEEKGKELINQLIIRLYSVACMLDPIMPQTSAVIKELIKANKSPSQPLFMRKE